MTNWIVTLCLSIAVLIGSLCVSYADHNLRQIERYCEVEWDGSDGELSCSRREWYNH